MNFLPSITLEKFVFGLQATSLLWSRWLPSDANVREDYDARAEETSTSIRAASVANANPILGAELAVIARNKAVADERRRTSPLGLIFALLKKPRTKPIGYFRDKYALKFFKKAYTECSHEEQLKVCHKVMYKSGEANGEVNSSMRRLGVILTGVRMGAVVAVGCTVLKAVHPAGVGLQQAVTWLLTYCGQLVCARVGGTTAVVWGVIAAVVAGEGWRPFGEDFGGAVVATCGAIAGGFALAYVAAMAPQWQGPHFPDLRRPFRLYQQEKHPQDMYLQKARFPIDGYDPLPGRALHQIPLQRGPDLPRTPTGITQPSSRRFLNRMFSNLPLPSNTPQHQSTNSNTLDNNFGRTRHRSETKISSPANSTVSVSTDSSSSQNTIVRQRRQLALIAVQSVASDSPNPLRAPPPSLLGPTHDNSTVSEITKSISSANIINTDSLNIPVVAFAELQFLAFAGNNQSSYGSPCSVWVIAQVLCSVNQGSGEEPFVTKKPADKSANNSGFLKSVALVLSSLQDCQISAILGKRTAATLSPDESITAIVLVTFDELLFPSARPDPREVSGRPQPSSSQRRPTSDLLNEELLNQLLGGPKRSSRAKEESVQRQVVKAKVTYDHSLFPPSHEISHEETFTVTRAPICIPQQASAQKTKLRKDQDHLQISGLERLNTEETEKAAESIIRVLSEGLRLESNSRNAPTDSTNHSTNSDEALRLLNDFLAAAPCLSLDAKRRLEMLKFRYSMFINHQGPAATQSYPSPKRYNPLERRKEQRYESFEPDFAGRSPCDVESDCNRRHAFEMNREEIDIEQAFTDVINRTMYRGHDLLSGSAHITGYDSITDLVEDTAIPRPLFSPKRGPTFAHSFITDIESMGGSSRSPKKTSCRGDRQDPETNIGSARFYEAEVEEMVRQAFGGATTCHHRSEFLLQSIEKDEKIEEDGNEKARKIWERMHVYSEGSGTGAKGTEVGFSDESADEAESERECRFVGTPWLA